MPKIIPQLKVFDGESERRCAACDFYRASAGGGGKCHAHPPTIDGSGFSDWPWCRPDYFCGEFTPKGKPRGVMIMDVTPVNPPFWSIVLAAVLGLVAGVGLAVVSWIIFGPPGG